MAEWTEPALDDFISAAEYVAADDPAAAARLAAEISVAVMRLDQFPGLGKPGRRQGTRELALPRIPFVIVYRTKEKAVTILRLLHSSRLWP